MKRYLITLLIPLFFTLSKAQVDFCGSEINADYAETFQNSMPEFYEYLSKVAIKQVGAKSANSNVKNSIPLNINIVRDDNGYTPMDTSLIRIGVKYMNEKFADAGLEFYICGNYNYINSTQYYNMNNSLYQAVNNTYGIPDVINVYFVYFIVHYGGGAAGVAPTPGGGDWIILRHNADTTVYAHEMGHFFGLLHTHGLLHDVLGDPYTEEYVNGSNCTESGDYFCDTPADPGLGPSNVNPQCFYSGSQKDGLNQFYVPDPGNLMSYAPRTCQNHFSPNQSTYMNWAYLTRRANLSCAQLNVDFNYQNSANCDSPYVFQFQNLSVGLSNIEWDVNDDGITDYTSFNPSHNFASPGVKWVSLKGTSGGKTYSRCKLIEIVAANQVPKLDDFNTGILPDAWKIMNLDHARQWELVDAIGADGLNSKVWGFNNFDFVGYEEEDYILTNAYDLRTFQNARLSFDIAYALHDNLDRLYVYISTDCGNTYNTQLINLMGGSLQTKPKQYQKFIPTENDWKNIVLPLDAYVGNFVSFKFVNYNEGGNVLYLDNVLVEGGDSTAQELGFAKTYINTIENSHDGQNSCKGFRIINVPLFISEVPLVDVNASISFSGTATDLLDFEITNPNLVFPSGLSTMQNLQIKIFDDAASEGTEIITLTVNVSGSSPFSTTTKNKTCTIVIQDNDPAFPEDKIFSKILLFEDFNVMNANEPPGWYSTVSDSIYTNTFWISSSFYNFWLFNIDDVTEKLTLDSTHYMLVANFFNWNTQLDSTYLYTPEFDVQDYDSLVLELDHWYETYIPDAGDLVIEAWDGSTWVNLMRHTNLEGSFGGNYTPVHAVFSLLAYSNPDFKIRFGIEKERIGKWYMLDNVKLTGFKTKARVATTLNASTELYLGPNELVHFYDDSTGDILGSIQNLSPWDYGCTQIAIDRAGNGALPCLVSDSSFYATEKTLMITPTNNNPTGAYQISLYYAQDEIVSWTSETANTTTDLGLVKTGGAISNLSPSNTMANGATNFEAAAANASGYLQNDYVVEGIFVQGFSGFAGVKKSGVSLPIELLYPIEATYKEGQGNVLEWTTATEINNDYFEIQRSSDGLNFSAIGALDGQGNSTSIHSYTFVDEEFIMSYNYYRFKQVDFNGDHSFSNIAVVQNAIKGGLRPKFYPNPTNNQLHISFESETGFEYFLLDINGSSLLQNKIIGNRATLDLNEIAKGVYIIKIIDERGILYQEKIVKI